MGVYKRVQIALEAMLHGPSHRRHLVAQELDFFDVVTIAHDSQSGSHQDVIGARSLPRQLEHRPGGLAEVHLRVFGGMDRHADSERIGDDQRRYAA